MLGRLRGFVLAAAFALPTTAAAQLQLNQNFVTQGPTPSFGPTFTVQSGDAPPNGGVAGAVGPVVADPVNANTLFVGTPWGGIWKTTNGSTTWTPLTDKQATLSISSLAFDPTDPARNTLIAGTGLTANGSVLGLTASGGLRERTVVHAGRREHVDVTGRRDTRQSERGRGCCARQCIGGGHL